MKIHPALKTILTLVYLFIFDVLLTAQTTNNQVYSFEISQDEIVNVLTATAARTKNNESTKKTIDLITPRGERVTFQISKNDLLSKEMEINYPMISTFSGHSIDNKSIHVNLVLFKNTIHAFILGKDDLPITIDPSPSESGMYISKYGERLSTFECKTDQAKFRSFIPSGLRTSTNGSTLKTYKLGIVITDEYEASNGTGAAAIATAVTTVSDINVIYKRDLAVSFTATIRPESLIYDVVPSGANAGNAARVVSKYFTIGEYDLGHVFHNWGPGLGTSGVAGLGVVCNNNDVLPNPDTDVQPAKAMAWSEGNPNNGYAYMSTIAHEIAHQFGASHTFNSNHSSACGPSLNAATSYEPGSGSTLMAYPGVCSVYPTVGENLTDAMGNVLYSSLPYFHVSSLEQMVSFLGAGANACDTETPTNNSPPTSLANSCGLGSPISIPANTPFVLKGGATDSDNSGLTYCWEQFDAGPAHGGPSVNCGATSGPIFRSYSPSSTPERYFPSLTYILNSNNAPLASVGECLPAAARNLNFKLTVRDNNTNGGGIDVSTIQILVNASVGPLAVSSPNTNVTYATGSSQTVTWSGSNTSSICNMMNISLSVDGGNTFPYILAANTPNDGTESITLPSQIPGTTMARIKVESNCNECVRFFDIGDTNFIITTSTCFSPNTTISPINAVTSPYNDPLLNLGLSNNLGTVVTNFTGSITTSDSPGSLIFLDNTPAMCANGGNSIYFEPIFFMVNVTGSYTINHGGAFGTVINLYQNQFTGSNCANHIGSSATRPSGTGGVSLANGLTVNLTANIQYFIMISGFSASTPSHPFNYTITFPTKPAGSSIYNGVILPTNYSYTYLAVNNTTGIVAAVNTGSNFTSLSGGSYTIYGASYYSGPGPNPIIVDPNTWVGLSLSAVQSLDSCFKLSANNKQVNVTCTTIVTSSANAGANTLRDIYSCVSEGGTITYDPGINSQLTAPLVINKNVIIQGNTTTTVDFNFTGTTGISINTAKILTLKDIKVNLQGAATGPVIMNNGELILNNVEITGNVNPVVQNNGGGTVQVQTSATIKKM